MKFARATLSVLAVAACFRQFFIRFRFPSHNQNLKISLQTPWQRQPCRPGGAQHLLVFPSPHGLSGAQPRRTWLSLLWVLGCFICARSSFGKSRCISRASAQSFERHKAGGQLPIMTLFTFNSHSTSFMPGSPKTHPRALHKCTFRRSNRSV